MKRIASTPPHPDSRWLRISLYLLVALAFLTGGSSQISGWDDLVVQLLSLPVLALGLWHIARLPASTMRNLALAAAALIALLPVLQLLPIPASLWHLPEARQRLAHDLAAVGATPDFRWSLAPVLTERAFLSLLPAMAAFVATLATGMTTQRSLLRLIMYLALFSLLLAFVQLGVPAESVLNPFPRWAAQFNGVFSNRNHQGISLVVAIIIALVGMLVSLRHVGEGRRQAWTPWVLGFVVLFSLCALPLTGSRAAVLIAVFAVALVPLALGLFDTAHLRHGWWGRAGLLACLALIALGLWGTVGWMQVDAVDELRGAMRAATLALGNEHAPLGTGIGAFVHAFAQGGPPELLLPNFINHAHNEYVQWWMEAGWAAVAVGTAVLAMLLASAIVALRRRDVERATTVIAILGLAALLAHSWVDYPLRTISLSTVAAVLAAILVTQATGVQRLSHGTPATGENDVQTV